MPVQIRVIRNWNKRNGFKLATFAKGVQTGMTDNSNYLNPPVTMEVLGREIAGLFDNYSNRKNGSKAKADYELSLSTVNDILIRQADFVDVNCGGQKAVLESSGFKSVKEGSGRLPVPVVPRIPTVKNENGELSLSIDAVPHATSYLWMVFIGEAFPISISHNQIQADNSGKFIMIPAGTAREVIRGLAWGTPITVQVLAQNSSGKSEFTMPVSTFAVRN